MDNSMAVKQVGFHEMELDDRLLKAIAKLGWQSPTVIQEKAISLILEGKDVLVRAQTGSGKTAAFAIPVVQKILNSKRAEAIQEIVALIVAPSKELCTQISNIIKSLTKKCCREVRCLDISLQDDLSAQKPLLVEKPDVVVGTPARILQHLKVGNMTLKKSLELLVIDEADLVLSFGYREELEELLEYCPNIYQAVLASATLSEDVMKLKKMVLHNPAILKLQEADFASDSQVTHYHLYAEEMEKATILYVLLKLHLIRGKTIIFVNTVDKCYKLKLYLEQFAIPTCVLNSELPASIRCHSVNQFNLGIYDTIIASDEKSLQEPSTVPSISKDKKKSKRKQDHESGVSRGIDFQCVANVINFDFPLTPYSYIHRSGRTARGNNQGSVLSFVNMKEKSLLNEVEGYLKKNQENSSVFKNYQFKLEEVEAFKYRAKDAWKAVTKIAVREARLKEIKTEILNSQKLKSYFEDNPTDFQVLRHDKALHTVKVQQHLSDVPEYIVPQTLKNFVGLTKRKRKRDHSREAADSSTTKFHIKKNNPLISMKFEGFKNNKKKRSS